MLPLFTFITAPDPSVAMASTSVWSTEIFSNLLPVLYIVAGLIIGGMILSKIIGALISGAKKVTGSRTGRSRGRRR